jgi:hypothetical protein
MDGFAVSRLLRAIGDPLPESYRRAGNQISLLSFWRPDVVSPVGVFQIWV